MKWLTVFVLVLFSSFDIHSQECTVPNIELSIKSNSKKIKLDSLWVYKVDYIVKNKSSKKIIIDTTEFPMPTFTDDDYSVIDFKIYYIDSSNRKSTYPRMYGDINDLTDLEKNSSKVLNQNEKYTYSFRLFDFYKVTKRGQYRIYAQYRKAIPNNQGYYFQQSKDYIEVLVE